MDDSGRQSTLDQLTHRELEVLHLIADGLSNQEIAERLFITLGTVKWYVKQLFSKLNASSRTQAVALARASGQFDPAQSQARPNAALNNLPVQLTSFIGREREEAEVRHLLTTTHLLTLTGSGGAGKTRLALEVASALSGAFMD